MPRLQNFFRPWRRAERPLSAEDLPLAFTTWASPFGQEQSSEHSNEADGQCSALKQEHVNHRATNFRIARMTGALSPHHQK